MVKLNVQSDLTPPPNRIAQWRKKRNLSQERLGEAIGTSGQFVGQLETGKRQLTQRWMTLIAEALGIQPAELLGSGDIGDDEPQRGQMPGLSEPLTPNARYGEMPLQSSSRRKVPVMGTGRGGKPGTFSLNTGEPIDFVDRPPKLEHKTGVYVIFIEGSSMEPVHFDGDMLFIDSQRRPFPGRDALVELHPETENDPPDALVKRVVQINPEFVELLEFQPKERKFRIPQARIKNLHLVLKNTDMY